MVVYGDFLCPYCRRLGQVLTRLRQAVGERLGYVFRYFPNERAHPGAQLVARAAEAAARQGRFWEMHDALYTHQLPLDQSIVLEIAGTLGLDMKRFERDLGDPRLEQRVAEDLADGRRNGVTGTPALFVDGIRYDGAWDFYSMLEALERPVGAQVKRTAKAFANLPASAGIVLLVATAAALICANTRVAPLYQHLVNAEFGVGPAAGMLSLTVSEWCSEGLLAIFFLILGLEIRREMTTGSLLDRRAATAPVLAALGGVIASAAIYLLLNPGSTARGWSVVVDNGVAFTLGIVALFGERVPAGLKVFVATFSVALDVMAILILGVFYPQSVHPLWFLAGVAAVATMLLFGRWHIYAMWPYLAATIGLWLSLHLAGVSGAISGIALAAFLPPRPVPSAGSLLAQAATALAELEHAERELKSAGDERRRLDQEPIWDWASRHLSAAADRLLSPAERVERAVAPWSTYVVLPLFAFTSAGVALAAGFGAPHAWRVFVGTALGLAIGKPAGMILAIRAAVKAKIAVLPPEVPALGFLGACLLCGIGDPFSFLLADQAFHAGPNAAVAKIGVLAGSALAALLGALALALTPPPVTPS